MTKNLSFSSLTDPRDCENTKADSNQSNPQEISEYSVNATNATLKRDAERIIRKAKNDKTRPFGQALPTKRLIFAQETSCAGGLKTQKGASFGNALRCNLGRA